MKTIDQFRQQKNKKKITMITCYDYTSACIVDQTNIDCVLVGDSGAMVMNGAENTTHATLDEMCHYTRAVARGLTQKLLIGDMPFLSYRRGLSHAVESAGRLIQAGAHAIKLEGATGNLDIIRHLIESGIPVMGHLGLTPQHVNQLSGFKVQAKSVEAANRLLTDAHLLEEAGCFGLVLECVPAGVARQATEALMIPAIGIGAGSNTDGQVLVFQDLLGLQNDCKPRFVKSYLNGAELFTQAINQFVDEVEALSFPTEKQSYSGEIA